MMQDQWKRGRSFERLKVALHCAAAGLLCAAAPAHSANSSPATPWKVAGEMGIMRVVIVPVDRSRDLEAYREQIGLLCEHNQTCFLNFHTNSTGAPESLPLAPAIDQEATVIFRRSAKQAAESFLWACRMKVREGACF